MAFKDLYKEAKKREREGRTLNGKSSADIRKDAVEKGVWTDRPTAATPVPEPYRPTEEVIVPAPSNTTEATEEAQREKFAAKAGPDTRGLAEEAQRAYDNYVNSDEYKRRLTERQQKYDRDAVVARLMTGITDIQQPKMLEDEKEQQLKAQVDYWKNKADAEDNQRITDQNLRELEGWSPEDQRALQLYAIGRNTEYQESLGMPNGFLIGQADQEAAPLIEKFGIETVERLAESWMREQNRMGSEKVAREAQEAAAGLDWGSAGHSAASVGANLAGGLTGVLGYIQELTHRTGQYKGLDPNNAGTLLNTYAGAVRGQVAQDIAGDVYDESGEKVSDGGMLRQGLSYGYQGIMSAADSLARLVAAGGNPVAVMALAGAGSFTQTVSEASEKGATPGQALFLGAVSACLEAATEYLPIKNLLDIAKGGAKPAAKVLKQVITEITEEEASLVGNYLAEAAILQGKSGYQQQIQQAVAEGMSYQEAREQADMAVLKEALETAVVSGISGGVSGGMDALATKAVMKATGKPLVQEKQTQEEQQEQTPPSDPAPEVVVNEEVPETQSEKTEQEKAYDRAMETVKPRQEAENEPRPLAVKEESNSVKEQLKANQDALNSMNPVANIQTPTSFSEMNKSETTNKAESTPAGESPINGSLATPIDSASTDNISADGAEVNEISVNSESVQQVDTSGQSAVGEQPGIKGTGAAERNFAGTAVYEGLLADDNLQKERATDVRHEEVPKVDAYDRDVSENAGNVMNSGVISDRDVDTMKQLIGEGAFGHEVQHMEDIHRLVKERIGEENPFDIAGEIRNKVSKGKFDEADIATAQVLFVHFSNTKGKRAQGKAAQLMLDLSQMSTQTGRMLNMFKLMRRMTPEGQYIAVQQTINRAVDNVNRSRSKKKQAAVPQESAELQQAFMDAARDAANPENAAAAGVAKEIEEGFRPVAEKAAMEAARQAGIRFERTRKGTQDAHKEIRDVLIENTQNKEAAAQEIARIAVEKMGMSGEGAETMAQKIIEVYYDNLAQQSARRVAQMFGETQNQEKVTKTLAQRLGELYNMGAFSYEEYRQAAFDSLLGENSGIDIPDQLMERFVNAADEAKQDAMNEIYKYAGAQIGTTMQEKWDAWRYMAMLGNPKTQIRNFFGNALMMPYNAVKRKVSAFLELGVKKENRTKAIFQDKGLLEWAKADRADAAVKQALEQSAKLGDDARNPLYDNIKTFGSSWAGERMNSLQKAIEKVTSEGDMLFKNREYAQSLAGFLKARGYTAEDANQGKIPGEVLSEAREYAVEQALKVTFNDSNVLSDALTSLHYKGSNKVLKVLNTLGEGLMPFRKTPANVVMRFKDYSPVGLVQGVWNMAANVRNGNVSAATAIDQISAGMTGTAAMFLGYALAGGIAGIKLTAGGADEDEKRQGHQNYALEFSINGQECSYTIDWASPANLPLFLGANLRQLRESEDTASGITALVNMGLGALEPLLELSCLSSVNDLVEGMRYAPEGEGLYTFLSKMATSYFTQGVPSLVRQGYQATQEYKQTTFANADDPMIRKGQQFAAGLPGDQYKTDKINVWGEKEDMGSPAVRAFNAFLNPGTFKKIDSGKLEQELTRLSEAGFDVTPSAAPKVVSYTDINGNGHDKERLTEEQYQTFAQTQGKVMAEVVNSLLDNEDYAKLPDHLKNEVWAQVDLYAQEQGKVAAIPDYKKATDWRSDVKQGTEARTIVQRVVGATLTGALSDVGNAWKEGWRADQYKKGVENAWETYSSLSREAKAAVRENLEGSAAKYVAAREASLDHDEALRVEQAVKTVKGTGSLDPKTKQRTVRDVDRWGAVAKTTGLTAYEKDFMMKLYMEDGSSTEKKYDYLRGEGYTPTEFTAFYRIYLEEDDKGGKVADRTKKRLDQETKLTKEEAEFIYKIFGGSEKPWEKK